MTINTPLDRKDKKDKNEKMLFLYKFFRAPKQIGSVTPSSRFLARKMVEAVPWPEIRYTAELGAGTGAITKFIHNARNHPGKFILFERDALLRERLSQMYPDYNCYPDATQITNALQSEGIPHLDCILSGLPFFNFEQSVRDKLLEQILLSLRPGGWFVAFQYSFQMKKQLKEHFNIESINFVPYNIPPAFVYVCRKEQLSDLF